MKDKDFGTLGPRSLGADRDMWKAKAEKRGAVLEWLIRMDDPNDAEGKMDRQRVNLTEIIRRAKEAMQ